MTDEDQEGHEVILHYDKMKDAMIQFMMTCSEVHVRDKNDLIALEDMSALSMFIMTRLLDNFTAALDQNPTYLMELISGFIAQSGLVHLVDKEKFYNDHIDPKNQVH